MGKKKQYTPLGRKIAQLVKNQRELAEILGLTQQSISGKLRGKIAVGLNEIELLSTHYDVPMIYFLADEEVTPEKARALHQFLTAPAELHEIVKVAAQFSSPIIRQLLLMTESVREMVMLSSAGGEDESGGPAFSLAEYLVADAVEPPPK